MRTICVFTCFLFLCPPSGAVDETAGDKLAREGYLRYCQAVNKKDLDAIRKIVDVPWRVSGKPIVKDRSELEKFWKDILDSGKFDNLPWTKFKVEPVATLREAAKEDKDFLAKLEKLKLTKEDRVVNDGLVSGTNPGGV
jgi:hypothetical protein